MDIFKGCCSNQTLLSRVKLTYILLGLGRDKRNNNDSSKGWFSHNVNYT